MSKQIFPLVVIVFSSILLSGCIKKTPTTQSEEYAISGPTEVAEAIQTGKPTHCTMTKGEEVWEYMVDGEMLRVNSKTFETGSSGERITVIGRLINDTKYIYRWDADTKKGSKVIIPSKEEIKAIAEKAKNYPKKSPSAPKFESEADYDNFKNGGYTIDCKVEKIDPEIFVVPTDIKFLDPRDIVPLLPSPDANGQIDQAKVQEIQKQYIDDFKNN